MNSVSRAASALVVGLGVLSSAIAQPLPVDPALVVGQLDNGLNYIVRQHSVPEGRAVVWVHMHTGSLNETDPQRGIAHYLEHMAFNGSENFAPGTLVPFFQSLGMQFGRDQNAFTNMEQTTYQLSLPDTKPETLGKGLTFFADVTGRLSLLPNEIDDERQIIQEERRRGLSGRQRTGFYVIERIAPGSLYGERITIGKEETIDSVKKKDFEDYYGKWYGASNATLMVIADANPNEVVTLIKEKFGSLPKKPKPTPVDVRVKAYDKSFAIVASDPEVRSEDIQIVRLEPGRPAITTVPQFRDDIVAGIAEIAMNRRLSDKVSKGSTSYLNGRVSMGNQGTAIYAANANARAKPGMWKETVEEIALEIQRGRQFGFTSREIEDAKKEMIASAERAVETEGTTPMQGLMNRLNGAVSAGEPAISPAQRLELLQKLLPQITEEEVEKRFAKEFDPTAIAFVATLPSGPNVPSESELLAIGTRAFTVQPTQESEAEHATQLMSDLPNPGEFVEFTEDPSSKVWSGWLSNNVRVHYRFMDERKNQASVQIALIGGELLENADNRGITSAAQLAWSRPTTQKLSSTDIRELMTGKKINVRGGGGAFAGRGGGRGGRGGGGGIGGAEDAITLNISGNPEELESGFQLAYLLLTQPKIEASSFDQFKTMSKEMLIESTKNPMMMGMRTSISAQYPETEPRTKVMTPEQVDRLSLASSQAWLDKLIKDSPIEVVVVGDVPKDKVVELAERYLGSLPQRTKVSANTYANLRKIERPSGPRIIEKTIDTPTPQAFVMSGFYGADQANRADVRALAMASRILSTRMVKEVREDAQLVYSIGAQSRAATTYPGFGMFSAGAPTEPSKVKPLVDKLASMYDEFAKNGPTEEEMVVARKQFANTFKDQLQDPGYWAQRLDQITFRGLKLEEIVEDPEAYQALTADQVKQVFAKYYSPDQAVVVTVRPAASASPGAVPAPRSTVSGESEGSGSGH
ncbi:MAG: insulinase family protein [Phycisphaeraceae bacterium]|nr:insulinase family protein [Phycisphaeraceae bacterium]